MDFAKVDTISAAEKGFDYTFIDPRTGEDTDAVFSLYGVGSRAYKQGQAKIDAYRSLQEKRGKKVDDEDLELLHAELLAKCTRGWKNVEIDGKKIEFSPENAIDLYSKYPVVSSQIISEVFNVIDKLDKN